MIITIKDLKGFDFSKKYLILDSNVKIDKDECFEQMNNKYKCQKYLNPYAPLDLSFINVIKENKEIRITEVLKKQNNPSVNYHKVYTELSKRNYDLLAFDSNFTTDKFPTNLNKEETCEYFSQMDQTELNSLIKSFSPMELELFESLLWAEESDNFYYNCFGNQYGSFYSKYNTVFKIKTKYYISLILQQYGFEINEEDIDKIFLILYDGPQYNLNDTNYNIEDLDDIYIKSKYLDFLNSIKQFGTRYCPIFPEEDAKYKLWKEQHPHRTKFEDIISRNTSNGIHNKYIDFAVKNNHLEKESGLFRITYTSNDNIKKVLRKYNLKVSGNKTELINRIKDNLTISQINDEFPSDDEKWNLSQEGIDYLNKYYYLTLLKPYIPSVFNLSEFEEIYELNSKFPPENILYALVNENWIKTDDATQDIKELVEELHIRNKYHVAWQLEKINLDLSIKLYESVYKKDNRCLGCERLRIIYKRKKDYQNELKILRYICRNDSDCKFIDRIAKLEKLVE